jgi:hypothetical protein
LKVQKCFNLAAEDLVVLDNAFVRVLRYLAAYAVANTPNFVTRIIVALDKLKFKSNRGTIKNKKRTNCRFFWRMNSMICLEDLLLKLH